MGAAIFLLGGLAPSALLGKAVGEALGGYALAMRSCRERQILLAKKNNISPDIPDTSGASRPCLAIVVGQDRRDISTWSRKEMAV